MKSKSDKQYLLVFVGCLFFVALCINCYFAFGRNHQWANFAPAPLFSQPIAAKSDQPPQDEGYINIVPNEWRGSVWVPKEKSITATILTDDVWWQIRLDHDDSKIFTLQPRNFGTNTDLMLPDSNVMEWRIKPGQKLTNAVIFWKFGPLKGKL